MINYSPVNVGACIRRSTYISLRTKPELIGWISEASLKQAELLVETFHIYRATSKHLKTFQ